MEIRNTEIRSILISVYHKKGLEKIVPIIKKRSIDVFSTGGTQTYLEDLGLTVTSVESLTSYPSILDGRVKTLHPKVFGGILYKQDDPKHIAELKEYGIPPFDCVVVDLYPFEQTLEQTNEERVLIEKIDIGGISLIRAAAKNYRDVLVIPSFDYFDQLEKILELGEASYDQRQMLAAQAFNISSHYDTAIFNYLNRAKAIGAFKNSQMTSTPLRYGENPHQKATFYGDLQLAFDQLQGKDLSFNNLTDIDSAIQVIHDFWESDPTVAILKHTNTCGLATGSTVLDAYKKSLEGDPTSAFGSVIISNDTIDKDTAVLVSNLFYEVLIAPDFSDEALKILGKKKKRVLLKLNSTNQEKPMFKSMASGVVEQDKDQHVHDPSTWTTADDRLLTEDQISQFAFANSCVKHLKSNAIAITKNNQLIGMGCGQTSRVDALRQAIDKAKRFGFTLDGAYLASDAFFPFSDCVEIAHQEGITNIIQPGGSIRDQDSINFCNEHDMLMVLTGHRHFKH